MILLIHEFFNLRFDEADEAKVDGAKQQSY